MWTNRRSLLALTAASAAVVSTSAVVLVSSVPDIAPAFALGGILAGGAALSAFVGAFRAKAALVTFAMFVSLLPLLAIAGGSAFLLWTGCWAFLAFAAKHVDKSDVVERITSSRTLA